MPFSEIIIIIIIKPISKLLMKYAAEKNQTLTPWIGFKLQNIQIGEIAITGLHSKWAFQR